MKLRMLLSFLLIITLQACVPVKDKIYQGKEQPAFETPEWFKSAIFYEIFVRSFKDSNGDGIGDFKGLTSKLDYLNSKSKKSLGISAIWLMPINPSPSYHGYDVTDYKQINPQYGSMADFEIFLKEAHKRGIKVIMDLVINHSSSQHPWFEAAASSPTSPYREFYSWKKSMPEGWGTPWGGGNSSSVWNQRNGQYYYAAFWRGMPDLNHNSAGVRKEVKDMMSFWLKKGVDGFRLDAVRYFIETGGGNGQRDTAETHLLLQEYASFVKKENPNAVLVGEAWSPVASVAKYYGKNNELDSAFNFDLSKGIMRTVRKKDSSYLISVFAKMRKYYPACYNDATFLKNHDMSRIANSLIHKEKNMRMVASILFTLPGTPFLYYGEEIGMKGSKPDPDIRRPMQWSARANAGFTTGSPWRVATDGYQKLNVALQMRNKRSIWSHYQRLIKFRKSIKGIASSVYSDSKIVSNQSKNLVSYQLKTKDSRYLVFHNLADKKVSLNIKNIKMGKLWPRVGITKIYKSIKLPAMSSALFEMK